MGQESIQWGQFRFSELCSNTPIWLKYLSCISDLCVLQVTNSMSPNRVFGPFQIFPSVTSLLDSLLHSYNTSPWKIISLLHLDSLYREGDELKAFGLAVRFNCIFSVV